MKKAQIVWITGASSGIGEALTYAFAARGAKLIISARRASELERVQSNCKEAAENIYVLPLDLEQYKKANEWFAEAKNKVGVPDILINNGGIGHLGTALEMTDEVEQKVMNINFWGQVALTKAVLPDMITRNSGKIVTVSSLLGHYGTAKLAAYAASKHALLGYFESLREELLETNVQILLASPGFVNTNVTLNSLTEKGDKYNKNSIAQEGGMAPEIFAKKLIKAIDEDKKYIYIGGKELLAIPLKHNMPRLFYTLYRWMAKRANN